MKAEPIVDMMDYQTTDRRDCFFKMSKYAWQREWRLALYRGVKEIDAYRLEIGSIRDIVECVQPSDLSKTIDGLFVNNMIKPCDEGYYGNISRKDMKEKFYQLGDNKAEMFFFMG